jgi:hypothetical protein
MDEVRMQLAKDPQNLHLAQAFERKYGVKLDTPNKEKNTNNRYKTNTPFEIMKDGKKVKVQQTIDTTTGEVVKSNYFDAEDKTKTPEIKDKIKNEFLSMQQSITDLSEWGSKHKDEYTGLWNGGWGWVQDKVGYIKPDEATFRQRKEMIIGPITKAIYGGHASDKDRQNIVDAMPKFTDNDEAFKAKLTAVFDRAKVSLKEKIAVWKEDGYDVTVQEKFLESLSNPFDKKENKTNNSNMSEQDKDTIFNSIF